MKSVPISFFYQVIFYQIFYCYCSHCYSYALELIAQDKTFFKFDEHFRLQCIEMAIWPPLYIHEKWCESNISGQVYVLSFQVKHFCKLLYVQQIHSYKSYVEFTEPQYFYLTGIQIIFQISVPSKTPLWNNIIFQQLSAAAISVWPLVVQDGLRWAFYIYYCSTYTLIKIVHIHKNIIYLIHYLQISLHYDSW